MTTQAKRSLVFFLLFLFLLQIGTTPGHLQILAASFRAALLGLVGRFPALRDDLGQTNSGCPKPSLGPSLDATGIFAADEDVSTLHQYVVYGVQTGRESTLAQGLQSSERGTPDVIQNGHQAALCFRGEASLELCLKELHDGIAEHSHTSCTALSTSFLSNLQDIWLLSDPEMWIGTIGMPGQGARSGHVQIQMLESQCFRSHFQRRRVVPGQETEKRMTGKRRPSVITQSSRASWRQ